VTARSLLASLVPKAIRHDYLLPAVQALRLGIWKSRWRAVRRRIVAPAPAQGQPRIFIIPSDLHELAGSVGDEAMLTVAVAAVWHACADAEILVATAGDKADAIAQARGMTPLREWDSPRFVDMCVDMIANRPPDAVLALGADALDGVYGPLNPGRALIFCDLAARAGIPVAVLGFSFSRRPAASLRTLFREAHGTIRFNLRDAISLARFESFSGRRGRLVADIALLLAPEAGGGELEEAESWAKRRRAAGDLLLAFNIHPMLFDPGQGKRFDALIDASARVLERIAGARRVSWLLVPHDYRVGVGGDAALEALQRRVAPALGERARLLAGRHAAAQIKHLAGRLDGTISGRMHLTIASLGTGVPAMGLSYQDKLEGLFAHFGLPDTLMLTPEQACDAELFATRIETFIDSLAELRRQIAARAEQVRSLAALNFDVLDQRHRA
jgi:polysaccharide pyruvyl transferase WcaK-like protein